LKKEGLATKKQNHKGKKSVYFSAVRDRLPAINYFQVVLRQVWKTLAKDYLRNVQKIKPEGLT
jgi:hypothetical protein